jgi:hypothetical protein
MTKPTANRGRLAALALVSSLALAGCGTMTDLAGVHPAPVEKTTDAPITADMAQDIATRVLDAAVQTEGVQGAEGDTARDAALTGTALELAKARATLGAGQADTNALTKPDAKGNGFPRVIFTTTLDQNTRRQYLETFVSADITQPYRLENRIAMLPGATLPAVGTVDAGTAVLGAGDAAGLAMTPQAAVEAYAAALVLPNPAENEAVDAGDAYASALKAAQVAQVTGLGQLATVAQTHTAAPETLRVLQLADGSALALGRINRVDTITAAENTQELKVPESLQKFTGKASATKSISINAIESVALLVPAAGQGKVKLIGVVEQLTGGAAE